jgi:hypothetical protein
MSGTLHLAQAQSNRGPRGRKKVLTLRSKQQGSIFEFVYRRLVLRLGHKRTIWAIAHRLCRLIWIILHQGVRYEERGTRMIRELRSLGYQVQAIANPAY